MDKNAQPNVEGTDNSDYTVNYPTNEEATSSSYGKHEVSTLTDDDLSEEVYGIYEGFKFVCPDCQLPSVMVHPDMGTFCTRCGRKFIIQSKTVTEFINKSHNDK